MQKGRHWWIGASGLTLSIVALGCRGSVEAPPPRQATTNAATTNAATATTGVAVSPAGASSDKTQGAAVAVATRGGVTERSAADAEHGPALLKLPHVDAVIEQPFPEGASDVQVCESIANTTEKDLWLRFGHLLPMYVYGSILIVDAKEKDVERVVDVVESYHGGKYYPSIKHCSSGGVLLYLRDLADGDVGAPDRGHRHLGQVIEQKLGLSTLESFGFMGDQARRSAYCSADAELCERLLKLDYVNEGRGLCARAMSQCDVELDDAAFPSILRTCRELPRELFVCLLVHASPSERTECEARVRASLCPR